MIRAWKVISSKENPKGYGNLQSRAAVSSCERFLFSGENFNAEYEQRNAVVTVMDAHMGEVVGKTVIYLHMSFSLYST